ncbi:YolD-like family protein [Edaphobacillus lindanitolerans]|uniref:YolD-like protein n=1 Tax=Edaphobacillus lindanitolerans TaxID=550447 RepID=A0A1U7PM49_9BACI|nr:YolD-like family protein [Edaphobacillus lindanitolerans]SIT81246.1 YolD-like protein [Edaphobacillus lindanitolerans]
MIRDRGNIKWTAMMLPEHLRLLREWQEGEGRGEPSEPDAQQLEEWDRLLHEALESGMGLAIRCRTAGGEMDCAGRVHHFDPLTGTIRMVGGDGEPHIIRTADVRDISVTG